MKKIYLLLLSVLVYVAGFAAPFFWVGGSSSNWNNAANWASTSGGAGGAGIPAANSDVTFDNGISVTVTYDLAGNDIGFASFAVINNTQLTLVNTVGASRSITINNSSSTYYEVVQSGSSLSLKSNTNNIFNFGSSTLSSGRMVFNGDVSCINQAVNTGNGPRLNSQDSIIINKLFYVGPSISATGSNPTGLNKFRISSTGTYQIDKNGGVIPGGKWEPGSLIKITGTTTSFPVTWQTAAAYGAIEFNAPAASGGITNLVIPANAVFQGNFTVVNLGTSSGIRFATTPTNITIQGDLILQNGAVSLANSGTAGTVTVTGSLTQSAGTLDMQASSGATTLNIAGDINQSTSGVFTELGTSTASAIVLNGTANQNLSFLPTGITNDVTLQINNTGSGATALTDISLPGGVNPKLVFTNGKITLGTNNLNVNNSIAAAVTGYSATSYIVTNSTGTLKRAIAAAIRSYDFPVGSTTDYKPATINYTAAPIAGTLAARFSTANPGFPNASPLTEGAITNINKTSKQGSWFVDDPGSIGGTYTATFTGNGAPDVLDYTKTVLLKRPTSGGDWTLNGTHITTTGSNTAPVLSRSGMSGFSEFAIGGEVLVALPININYFTGVKQNGTHLLNWKINVTNTSGVSMSIERSADGSNFTSINNITADAVRCLQPFDYTDNNPLPGTNYYRLKMTDADGKITYSNKVVLLNKETGFEITGLLPSVVNNNAALNITAAQNMQLSVVVTDLIGRVVQKNNYTLVAGNNKITMNFSSLASGNYQISGYTANEKTKTIRFIKQ